MNPKVTEVVGKLATNPKMIEVLGNLALKLIEEGMKQQHQQTASAGRPQLPGLGGGYLGGPGVSWPPVPPVFPTPDFSSMFDPSGFNPMFNPGFGPAIGWNGNPYFY